MSTLLVDRSVLGGALALTTHIANYPGLGFREPMAGSELLRLMHEHAEHFGARRVQTLVYGIEITDDEKVVITAEQTFRAKTLIIATGAGSRDNKLPGEEEFLGRGVSYCATCDAAFFAGRAVAVLGNSHEAIEEAAVLAKQARSVTIVSGSSKMIASPDEVDRLLTLPNVEVLLRRTPLAIVGDQSVEGLRVRSEEGEENTIPADGVFVYLPGARPATQFLEGKLKLDERGYVVTDANLQTSLPGVYAAGDVRGNQVRQVVIAAADGCLAALGAERYVRRGGQSTPQW